MTDRNEDVRRWLEETVRKSIDAGGGDLTVPLTIYDKDGKVIMTGPATVSVSVREPDIVSKIAELDGADPNMQFYEISLSTRREGHVVDGLLVGGETDPASGERRADPPAVSPDEDQPRDGA